MKRRRQRARALVPEMSLDVPWAINEAAGRLIQAELERWAHDPKALNERRAAIEIEAAASRRVVDPFEDGPGYELHDRVAVIRFEGVVSKRLSWWGYLFGGTASTEVLAESLQNALEDAAVASILLYIDSPGGCIRGVREAADLVYAARTKKAIWTLFSDCGASAAYEIGSQATKCFANTPDADVGSIGVLMSFFDYSQALAAMGIKAEVIRSAPLKGAGSFGTALSPEQRTYLQETVDTSAANFTETVARGRGFTPEQGAAVSTGRCWMAAEALSLGLIDGISTLTDLIGPLQAEGPVVPDSALIEPVEVPDEGDGVPDANGETSGRRIETISIRAVFGAPVTTETGRDPSAPIDPSSGAGAQAPKENDMDEAQVNALIAQAVAPVTAKVATLETENAALKAQLDGASATVSAIQADHGLQRFLADALGQNGAAPKLAAADTVGRELLVLSFTKEGEAAARKRLEAMPVLGPPAGSVLRGTRAHPGVGATSPASSAPAFPFDAYRGSWVTSSDPVMKAYGAKVCWGADQMAAGVKFRSAQEWLAAYDAAHAPAA